MNVKLIHFPFLHSLRFYKCFLQNVVGPLKPCIDLCFFQILVLYRRTNISYFSVLIFLPEIIFNSSLFVLNFLQFVRHSTFFECKFDTQSTNKRWFNWYISQVLDKLKIYDFSSQGRLGYNRRKKWLLFLQHYLRSIQYLVEWNIYCTSTLKPKSFILFSRIGEERNCPFLQS